MKEKYEAKYVQQNMKGIIKNKRIILMKKRYVKEEQ
jgi:hypothetical protein